MRSIYVALVDRPYRRKREKGSELFPGHPCCDYFTYNTLDLDTMVAKLLGITCPDDDAVFFRTVGAQRSVKQLLGNRFLGKQGDKSRGEFRTLRRSQLVRSATGNAEKQRQNGGNAKHRTLPV
jgi:hypothetical protein